jgi:hypothetical protein
MAHFAANNPLAIFNALNLSRQAPFAQAAFKVGSRRQSLHILD